MDNVDVLDILDLSIVRVNLDVDEPTQSATAGGFWHYATPKLRMPLILRKIVTERASAKPISPDFKSFSDAVVARHKFDISSTSKRPVMDRPNEVDDQVAECTPQFILRNIPKIEKYYDLERNTYFDVADMPKREAEAALDEVKNAHIGGVEFIPVESVDVIDDFRTFIEEIVVLCPWDNIPKDTPPEGHPWSVEFSKSRISHELLALKDKFIIYSDKRMSILPSKR